MSQPSTLSMNCTISQAHGFVASDMYGEKVMMSMQNGNYYNLGETGGRIWDIMESPITVEQMIGRLVEEYEIDPSECEQQVLSFLQRLLQERLIQVV